MWCFSGRNTVLEKEKKLEEFDTLHFLKIIRDVT